MGNKASPTKGANACEARLPGTDLTDTRPPAGRIKLEVAEAQRPRHGSANIHHCLRPFGRRHIQSCLSRYPSRSQSNPWPRSPVANSGPDSVLREFCHAKSVPFRLSAVFCGPDTVPQQVARVERSEARGNSAMRSGGSRISPRSIRATIPDPSPHARGDRERLSPLMIYWRARLINGQPYGAAAKSMPTSSAREDVTEPKIPPWALTIFSPMSWNSGK